ncbi:hypothetical protein RJZ90_005168 [Blastomyces dermatitidis]
MVGGYNAPWLKAAIAIMSTETQSGALTLRIPEQVELPISQNTPRRRIGFSRRVLAIRIPVKRLEIINPTDAGSRRSPELIKSEQIMDPRAMIPLAPTPQSSRAQRKLLKLHAVPHQAVDMKNIVMETRLIRHYRVASVILGQFEGISPSPV